jgi:putative Ca2+/H+ antiporter (TMEM165/GDT1 family)
MWFRRDPGEEELALNDGREKVAKTIWVSFVVIFIAEWGDLTQFSTAILAARHGRGKVFTVFLAAILALWAVTALAIAIGNRAKKVIHPAVLKKIAAVAFIGIGLILLAGLAWPKG